MSDAQRQAEIDAAYAERDAQLAGQSDFNDLWWAARPPSVTADEAAARTVEMANTMGVNPRATVEVDRGDGVPQRWAGSTWNDQMIRADRSGEPLAARVIEVHPDTLYTAWTASPSSAEVEGRAR